MLPSVPTSFLAATIAALAVAAGAASPAQAACANETKAVGETGVAELRTAVVCLTNEARSAAGLMPLAAEARLEAAAQGHATDMQAKKGYSQDTADSGGSC